VGAVFWVSTPPVRSDDLRRKPVSTHWPGYDKKQVEAFLEAAGIRLAAMESTDRPAGPLASGALEVADYAYAVGNVGFANIWIAMASFAVCSGWVILSTGVLERWMGWWIVVAGLGLAVARFAWTAGFWGVGYALFWLWIIVVCIRLIVRPDRWSNAER
jgi:hypothetical protein